MEIWNALWIWQKKYLYLKEKKKHATEENYKMCTFGFLYHS